MNMRKLFMVFFAALAVTLFSMMIISCGPDEPDTPGGNGGGGQTVPTTVAVTGVSLSKTSLSLVEGGSETLTATVAPTNATNKAVSWKSSDTGVATVDNSGKVTAVKAGSATITVTTTDGSKTATCSVTVTSKTVNVTGVTLDKTEIEMTEGAEETLIATVAPADATNKDVTWSTSDSNIAGVSDGKVTAVKEGEATITVTTSDGSKTATCKVKVKAITLEGLSVNPATLEIVEGETKQLEVKFNPESYADKSVNWASDNKSVATVDENGLVKAVKPGECKIYVESAKDKTKQAFCEVTVTPDPTLKGISFPYTSLTMKKGETKQIQVVFDPEYANNKNVTWESSDPAVATVDNAGSVTAVWNGEADITATSQEGGLTATCKVTVSQQAGAQIYTKTPEGIFLNGEQYTGSHNYLNDVYSNGTDLFEAYDYAGIYKNGSPLIKGFYSSGDLVGVVAGKLYYYDTDVIRIYDCENGQYLFERSVSTDSGHRNEAMAVAPDGTAYVVGYSWDAFSRYVARLWTISKDFKVSEKTMFDGDFEEYGRDVAIDPEGNVWALTKGKGLNLYKNGEFVRVIHAEPDGNHDHFISFHGGDMYIVTTKDSQKEIVVYKNDKIIYDITDENGLMAASKLKFSENGDSYFAAVSSYSYGKSYVYKNGEKLYTLNSSILYRMEVVN